MRQKIVLYGNCQGKALKKTLDSIEVFKKHFDIINLRVYQIKRSDFNEVIETVKKSKYFIYQPVGNYKGFRKLSSNYLQGLLSSQAQAVSFPSIYFNGYTPYVVHLKKKDGSRFATLIEDSDIHDRNILIAFYENKTIDQTYEIITQNDFYSKEQSLKFVNDGIRELERREKDQNLDITVSDLIKNNYKESLLFHTVNHPTTELLKKVAIRIAHKIGISLNEKQDIIIPKVLHRLHYSIYPSTYNNLELKFPQQNFYKYHNNKISIQENIEQIFNIYESKRDEIEYAISGVKAHDFVTKTFALELPKFISQADKEIGTPRNYELIAQLEKGELSRKQYIQNLYCLLEPNNIKSKQPVLSVGSQR